MKVDTMRKVDFYAGVPLCFLATWIRKALDLFASGPSVSAPRKVLLIELSEMGSAILVDPAMRKLKRAGCELYFVIFKKNKPSLDLLKTVAEENIFTIREDSFGVLVKDTLRFLLWCRKNQIDTIIDLELFSRFTALLTGFSGATRRVGYYKYHNEGVYRGDMLTHKVWYNPHMHIAKNFISLVNACLAKTVEVPFTKSVITDEEIGLARAEISPAHRESVQSKLDSIEPNLASKSLVLINANASDMLPQRRWPKEFFAALIVKILQQYPKSYVLLTGAPQERTELDQIVQMVGHKQCINFAGAVKFAELPALYDLAKVMISNDSGPPHFASVTELPTFVLFGPETPSLYGALGNSTPITLELSCSPCVSAWNHRKTPCSDNQCMKQLSPELVFQKVSSKLNQVLSTPMTHSLESQALHDLQ